MERPAYLPAVDERTAPFWAALTDGRLLLAWCDGCAAATYPPVDADCPSCNRPHGWREATGDGRLWSWTTFHREYVADYPLGPPYTVLMVDLPEGPRMLATLAADVDPTDLRPDSAMVFDPRQLAPGVVVPGFRPRS